MAFQDLQTAEHLTRSKNPRDEKIIQMMSPLRDSIVVRGFELLFFGGDDRLLDLVGSIVSLPLAVVQPLECGTRDDGREEPCHLFG